ncbi:hypothetical protein FRB99_002173 [Tulasnella sp. 403]|nr:hypothetical protein FRB99_002173 [Tulasnella sp. 403]
MRSRITLETLPPEILLLVLDSLPKQDILELCKTSRMLHTLATPCLYRHVRLTSGRSAILFFHTIINNTRLASLVLSYDREMIRYYPISLFPVLAQKMAKYSSVGEMEAWALKSAVNLQDLCLHLNSYEGSALVTNVLSTATFQLRRLAIFFDTLHTPQHGGLVLSFIRKQPSLKHLDIPNTGGWQANDLPNLDTLSCCVVKEGKSILPGCPVALTTLNLQRSSVHSALLNIVPHVSEPLSLKVLRLRLSNKTGEAEPGHLQALSTLFQAFPNLESLTLSCRTRNPMQAKEFLEVRNDDL